MRLPTSIQQAWYTINTTHSDCIGYDCDVNKVNNQSTRVAMTAARVNHPGGGHYRTGGTRVAEGICQNISKLVTAPPIVDTRQLADGITLK